MCGRFALTVPHDAMVQLFQAVPAPDDAAAPGPRYNICPTQAVDVVHLRDGARHLRAMRWGFIPHWYKTLNGGPLIINARAETIAGKPAFAEAARSQRCLIPASGFYEWHRADDKTKTPFWVHPSPVAGSNLPLTAFAGIWRDWQGPEGPVACCAIVTTPASTALSAIHHRAPLALRPADWPLWLGEAGKGAARLMVPPAEDFWAFHQVGAAVGNRLSDGPELMDPVQPPTT